MRSRLTSAWSLGPDHRVDHRAVIRFRRRRERETPGVVRGPGDDPSLTDEQILAQRTAWFETYTSQLNVFAPPSDALYTCPCCGHPTLTERAGYDICRQCGWEDDGQDDHDSDVVRGGPNGRRSLDAARAEYEAKGGLRGAHVPPSEPS